MLSFQFPFSRVFFFFLFNEQEKINDQNATQRTTQMLNEKEEHIEQQNGNRQNVHWNGIQCIFRSKKLQANCLKWFNNC